MVGGGSVFGCGPLHEPELHKSVTSSRGCEVDVVKQLMESCSCELLKTPRQRNEELINSANPALNALPEADEGDIVIALLVCVMVYDVEVNTELQLSEGVVGELQVESV